MQAVSNFEAVARFESREHGIAPNIGASLPAPLIIVDLRLQVILANPAAEQFFGISAEALCSQNLTQLLPPGSLLLDLIAQVRRRAAPIAEHEVMVASLRGGERIADVSAAPCAGSPGDILLMLWERDFARRLDRQLGRRDALRALDGMAAVLAHEIKNPLAGIRGAAQLLEESVGENERALTQLICAESDRIRALIDRMESFGDNRPLARAPVNIHEVLDRARKLAKASFARHASFSESYDPSLPSVSGDRDRLIQAFVNLIRNASDALPQTGGEIALATAFRAGMRLQPAASEEALALPLEVGVRDNGSGIAPDLLPHIFDPFVTTKVNGAGLGLALVSKIVADHGGVIECESTPGRTLFRVLLPICRDEQQ